MFLPNELLASLEVRKTVAGTFALTSDFSPLGGVSQSVEVWRAGSRVSATDSSMIFVNTDGSNAVKISDLPIVSYNSQERLVSWGGAPSGPISGQRVIIVPAPPAAVPIDAGGPLQLIPSPRPASG